MNKHGVRRKFTLFTVLILAGLMRLSAQVTCHMSASFINGCPPLVVNFQDLSTGGGTSWFWDFDQGVSTTSTLQNPTATFFDPGFYNVRHVVYNGSDSDVCFLQIHVFQPPFVNFTSNNNSGCIHPCHQVDLINLTQPGDAQVVEYVWNFGDGAPAQSSTPPNSNMAHCYDTAGAWDVLLIARDANGCQANKLLTDFVTIGNHPNVTASANPLQSCVAPTNVTFTSSASSSNGAVTYQWFFGDNGTSALQNPTHNYASGIYDPFVRVTDPLGCQADFNLHVEITKAIPDFSVPSVNACNGLPLQFTDETNFATAWTWLFGDGGSSTLQNPTHTYTTNGTYTVTLIVAYNNCPPETLTRTNYITVSTPVSPSITADDTSDCFAPLTVNFTGNAPGATAYSWNFGDSTGTSSAQNPTHTYTTTGSFTVSLSATNSQGCVSTATLTNFIDVGALNAGFAVDSDRGCSPLVTHFTNTSTSNVPITGYQWFFGDNTTASTPNPVHTYTAAGTFVPMLVITNADGCTDTATYTDIQVGGTLHPGFSASPLIQCVNQTVSFFNNTTGAGPNTTYLWDFGDNSTSILINPTHEYSDTGYFTITLTVINQGCRADTARIDYVLIVVPKAEFDFDFSCNSPTTVAFHDSSQGADSWFWDFGDGTTSTTPSPTHTYPAQSNYTVTLTVTNNTTGCVDSMKKTLPIGQPEARIYVDTFQGCKPLTVHFRDSSVFASSWLWKFGDGPNSQSTQQNPTHTYADTGRYTVTLIINPGDPCADTVVEVNYIRVYGSFANFTASPVNGCAPLTTSYTDVSTAYMGTITAWSWSFGDGDSSFIKNPSHTFNATENAAFVTRLVVTDNHGCRSSRTLTVRVFDPAPDFTSDTAVCPGEAVQFTNTSTGGNTYLWRFGDGTTSTLQNPTHTYTSTGVYAVTLVATNGTYGCVDSITKVNYLVVDTPTVDFFPQSAFAQCPPFPVQFHNISSRTDLQWLWYFGDGDTSSYFEPLHVYFYPGDYDVTLVGYDSSGCSDSITYLHLIHVGGPIGNFTVSNDSGCVPLTITITGNTQSTVSIVADLGDGTAFQDTINITHTYNEAGLYYPIYTLTDSLGCQVPYKLDTFVVGIIPYPNLPPDTTVCKGNYIQFNLADGDFFSWTANLSPDYLSCTDCPNPLSTAPDTITYYVTASTNIGCTASDTILVNVDALPIIFPGISFRICYGDTLQLNAGPGVQQAVWTPNQFIDDTNSVSPRVWPPDSAVYRVTGANQTGCSISRIVRINVIDSVQAEAAFGDTLLCEGGQIQLNINVTEASFNDTTIRWIPGNYLSSTVIPNPLFSAPHGEYNYTVIVSSQNCVPDTENVHIVIAPKPTVEAGDDQIVAIGTNVQIWAASPNPVNYVWTPTIDSMSCTECRRPFITVNQNQTVYVTAYNEWGCAANDSVVLQIVNCDPNSVFVPNTFTPNGDGLNDMLYVRGIGLRKLEYFRVFDRWGRLVWETKEINDGWDGNVNGRQADIATYVYVVKGICSSNEQMEKHGNVTLVR